VVEKVGDLPLLLSLCGSYVRERNSTFPELLNWFEEPGAPDARASSVAACTKLAVTDMEAESAEAVALLNCCAFLAEDEIPFELFTPAAGTPAPDQATVRRAAQTLSRRSLASISESGLRIHPLIADAMQARLTPMERDHWISEAARLLARGSAAVERSKGITQAGALLPHAMAVAEHAIKQRTSLVAAARLLCEVGLYYRSKGDIEAAKAIMERALAIAESEPTMKPAERAGILDQLGGLFEDIGDFTSAHSHYETAIAVLQDAGDARLLGRELLNRGRVLFNLGRHVDAVATFGEAVAIARREASRADIAAALGNIGSAYRSLGDWSAAISAFEEAMAIHHEIMGATHPAVADDLSGLGSAYRGMGDPAKARELFERALEIDRRQLGEQHPSTLVRMNNLATVLTELGEYGRAAALLESATNAGIAVFGDDHPRVGVLFKNLAQLAVAEKQPEKALAYYQRALTLFERSLGPGHPYTREITEQLEKLAEEARS
jgi:tetratricopeptide (TPR) repeat protein